LPSPRIALAVSLAAVITALTACGGSDTLSKADYTKQATAVCKSADSKTNALPQPAAAKDLAPYLVKGTEITESSIGDYKALKPPKELRSKHDTVVKALDAQLADLKALNADIKGGTAALGAVKAATPKLDADQKTIATAFNAMGLQDCAKTA
jgi:thiamine monophosphate kinase